MISLLGSGIFGKWKNSYQKLDGTEFVSIACNLFEGISVTGNEISDSTNFKMMIASYSKRDLKSLKIMFLNS